MVEIAFLNNPRIILTLPEKAQSGEQFHLMSASCKILG
jgi:hypothetical protein